MKNIFTYKAVVLITMLLVGAFILSGCGHGPGYDYASHKKRNKKHHMKHGKLPRSDTGIGFNNSMNHGH